MKMPWTNTTVLAKAVAIFATGLVICLGLCGLNLVAVMSGLGNGVTILGTTAWLELSGMVICAAGLVAVLIVGMLQAAYRQFFGSPEFSKLDLQQSDLEDPPAAPKNETEDK